MREEVSGSIRSRCLMAMLSALLIILSLTPAAASDQQFAFVVMGDSRGNGKDPTTDPTGTGQINQSVLVKLKTKIINLRNSLPTFKPEFMVFLGDMSMYGGTANINAWKALMDQTPALGIPYFVTVGNHELYAAHYANKRLQYQKDFNDLLNNPTPVFYTERENYLLNLPNLAFSFRKGNALFVILDAYYVPATDNEPPQIGYISDAQYSWMIGVLAKAYNDDTIKHKFVFAHAPLDCTKASAKDPQKCVASHYWPIKGDLKTYNVDAFFAGHDHVFAYHIYSYDYKKVIPATKRNGMLLTSGRAGASKYHVNHVYPSDQEVLLNHFLYVKVDGDNWQIFAYNDKGGLEYQFDNGVKRYPP